MSRVYPNDFELKAGMILFVTVCRESNGSHSADHLEGCEPAYCVVINDDNVGRAAYVKWLGGREINVPAVGGHDEFDIIPDEDVPDWVWVEIARRSLLGELTKL